MEKYKNLFVNILLFAINSVANKLVAFVLLPLYTYYLSSEEYGILDMSVVVISLLTPLVTLSIADAAVRFIIDDREQDHKYALIALVVTTLSVVLVLAICPILDLDIFGGLGEFKFQFVLVYAITAFSFLFGEVERGLDNIKIIPFATGVSSLANLVLAYVFIGIMDMRLCGYFLALSAGTFFSLIIYLFPGNLFRFYKTAFFQFLSQENKRLGYYEAVKSMFRYALPLVPNALFWWMGTGLSRFFITGALGIAASGLFAAASKVPNLINSLYSVFQQAWQLSAFQEAKKDGIGFFYSTIFCVLQAIVFIFSALLSACSPWIAAVMLQGETFSSWPMISTLLLANLLNVMSMFYGTVYTSSLNTKYIMKTTIYGALVVAVLTPIMLALFDLIGAAIALVAGQLCVFFSRALDSKKHIAFHVGWACFIPSFVLLVLQSALSFTQVANYQYYSIAVFIGVATIQVMHVVWYFKFKKQ